MTARWDSTRDPPGARYISSVLLRGTRGRSIAGGPLRSKDRPVLGTRVPLAGTLASICLVAGCGATVAPGTASPDAAPDADPHGPVHVTVLDVIGNGAPAPNIPVVFIDPDGTIAADVITDGEGGATATVLPGASVSVVYQKLDMTSVVDGNGVTTNTTTTTYTVVTILAIKPGDDLPIGFTDRDTTQTGTFTVSYTPSVGATNHTIVTPCGSFGTGVTGSVTTTMRKSCQRGTFDVLVVASDASGVRASASVSNVNLAAGSAVVPNQYTSAGGFATAYSDVPTELTRISLERISGVNDNGFSTFSSCVPSAGSCAITVPAVATAGPTSIVASSFVRGTTSGNLTQRYVQRVGGNNLNYTLDVATNLLPWMTNVTFDQTTSTSTPIMDAPDIVSDVYGTEIVFGRSTSTTNGTVITKTDTNVDRFILGPTAEAIAFPVLPPHVGPIAYQPTDIGTDLIGVRADSTTVDGWDQARARAFELVDAFQKFTTDDAVVRGQLLFAVFPPPVSGVAPPTRPTNTLPSPQLLRAR